MLIELEDLIERLRDAARGVAAGVPHALFAIHLEPFARAADECGEEGASALEQVVLGALQMQIGHSLCIARVSGDDFALLKDRCLPRDAPALAQRLRGALQGGTFRWHGRAFRLDACVGAVEVLPEDGQAEAMLSRALEACYAAQALGSRGILVVDGDNDPCGQVRGEQQWRDHIREILA